MKFIPLPTECQQLEQLPNVCPSIAADLRLVGIQQPSDLKKQDAYTLYQELCRTTGKRHDPCMIDVFISAIRYMHGHAPKSWWAFTDERKHTLQQKAHDYSGYTHYKSSIELADCH
jgi:Pathogenicity locus